MAQIVAVGMKHDATDRDCDQAESPKPAPRALEIQGANTDPLDSIPTHSRTVIAGAFPATAASAKSSAKSGDQQGARGIL